MINRDGEGKHIQKDGRGVRFSFFFLLLLLRFRRRRWSGLMYRADGNSGVAEEGGRDEKGAFDVGGAHRGKGATRVKRES